jgi:peptidoglycan hydrolase-like protein with peptidoglycan-binding domain
MLRRGSTGPNVRAWQQFLIGAGHLPAHSDDGIFGPRTQEATRSYQTTEGFPPIQIDGIAGPLTLGSAYGQGFDGHAAAPDLVRVTADGLGIDPDLMRAFEIVESGGRADAVRFEPHLARRKMGERASDIPYTPKSRSQKWSIVRTETSRGAFDRAHAMHEDQPWRRAMIESSSWGLFQVLGSHLIGIFGVDDAVESFTADPEIVSHAILASWFRATPQALRAAKAEDLRKLTRFYNGPGNVDRYSSKLAEALIKVRGRA